MIVRIAAVLGSLLVGYVLLAVVTLVAITHGLALDD